jgi:hypothetical protein
MISFFVFLCFACPLQNAANDSAALTKAFSKDDHAEALKTIEPLLARDDEESLDRDAIDLRDLLKTWRAETRELEESKRSSRSYEKLIRNIRGRSNGKAPQWWLESMASAKLEAGSLWFDIPGPLKVRFDNGLGLPPNARLLSEEVAITLEDKSDLIIPISTLFTKRPLVTARLLVSEGPDRIYVAAVPDFPTGFHMLAVNRMTRKVDWTRRLWGSVGLQVPSRGHNVVSIVPDGDSVRVFGACTSDAFYAEIGDRNGEVIIQCSSRWIKK